MEIHIEAIENKISKNVKVLYRATLKIFNFTDANHPACGNFGFCEH